MSDFIEALQNSAQPDVEYGKPFNCAGSDLDIAVGLPVFYRRRRQTYPLLVLLNGEKYGRGAIDITRLMADAGEAKECIVLSIGFSGSGAGIEPNMVDGQVARDWAQFFEQTLLPWCLKHYRVRLDAIALFGHGLSGALVLSVCSHKPSLFTDVVAVSPALKRLSVDLRVSPPACRLRLAMGSLERRSTTSMALGASQTSALFQELNDPGQPNKVGYKELSACDFASTAMAMLSHFMLHDWGSGKAYGAHAPLLEKPWVARLAALLRPVARTFSSYGKVDFAQPTSAIIHSATLERDFELMLSLPESAEQSGNRYPMILVLDANYAFNLTAEAAREYARSGDCEEVIVVGIGVPRREGPLAFALRRLQEFAPSKPGYTFDDSLGRILSSIYSISGLNILEHPPKADVYYRFIHDEVLPKLLAELPIDRDRLSLFGHSAGGTFTAFALMQDNAPFHCYAMSSPGLDISDGYLLNQSDVVGSGDRELNVLVSIGSEEYANYFNQRAGIHKSADYAKRLQSTDRVTCDFVEFNLETHSSVIPRAVQRALLQFFPGAAKKKNRGIASAVAEH